MDEKHRQEYVDTKPLLYADSVRHVAEMSGPRTVKTHLAWNFLPVGLRQPDSQAKVSSPYEDPPRVNPEPYWYSTKTTYAFCRTRMCFLTLRRFKTIETEAFP